MGEDANYDFQLEAYAAAPDVAETFIDWDYDAYGRKIAETVYDNTNTVTSQTVYVYDGWRLVSELDALHNYRVVAEYIPGPAYVDDTVAARRDINRDGDFDDANEGFLYFLTDQQYSTVALLDETGAVVERYGYDPFGAPSIYNADATATLSQSAMGNARLYTGRDYLPALGVYDYRQRAYDPATGRFLTTDPIGPFGDPANLVNPYTYVANNPGSFVDPYGGEGWREYIATIVTDPFRHYILGTLGGDNSLAFARHEARQSSLINPAAAGETFGETGERYAPHVGPQLGHAFDDTLEDASRSGLAGAQFLAGPAGAAANAIAVADDIGQGNWGSAILGGAGAVGSIKGIAGAANDAAARAANAGKAALPELRISASKYPDLAENIRNAQKAGHPDVLTYGGRHAADINRFKALDEVPRISSTERDEYPFASTFEGGDGAWVGHVPKTQNRAQGGLIRDFVKSNNLKPGDKYRVVIEP